jgi:outer membrane protein OmpA-like peptidoglycan-associated protein
LSVQSNLAWLPNANQQYYFHNAYGLLFRFGKSGPKDSDKDGVTDDKDLCPQQAGTLATNGCPDKDGDGVKDSDDLCPDAAGTLATKGCPDKDGDGVTDSNDNCPDLAGVAKFNGCPDSDGDGVPDKDDACPNEKGLASLKGCADRDGDGVADKDDKCPELAGVISLNGCPDKDGDGVTDSEDGCPDVAGIKSNKGCPEIKAEEVKSIENKLNISAKRIQFETASAKIKTASFAEIDQIVSVMNQYSFTQFDIEGYTDNTGKLETNKSLSQQRADAVKDYIVGKGIATNRLFATGYGPDRPIATNNTAAGRAENRRVEIHLKK